MGMLIARWKVLWLIAMRNIFSHKLKSGIVSSILIFGTFLVVVGTSMLDSIEDAMAQSIISSMAGHLQLYSKDSKDKLSLFGQIGTSDLDLDELDDYGKIEAALTKLDNVEAVMPMGLGVSVALTGNTIDRALDDMRKAKREGKDEVLEERSEQIRQIAKVIEEELDRREEVSSDTEKIREGRTLLEQILSKLFWEDLDLRFEQKMQTLETKLAPLSPDGRIFWVRYIGTDMGRFPKEFSRFRVLKGQAIPPGSRGLMLSKRLYDRWVKNKIARDFDDIHEEVVKEGRVIAEDKLLRDQIEQMSKQYGRIMLKLKPDDARALEKKLRAQMPGAKGDLSALLQAFLKVDDTNIARRYRFFYDVIGEHVKLYDLNVGDVVTLRTVTRSGYVRSTNVKIWGVFAFKGLEDSDLAGVANLIDIMTFRDMYGKMTAEQRQELADLRQEVGVDTVKRDDAEAELFGSSDVEVVEEGVVDGEEGFDEFANVEIAGQKERMARLEENSFNRQDINDGFVLNAAVILKDPEKIEQTRQEILAISEREGLGLAVLNWREASGLVGQFVLVVNGVLFAMIAIMFLIALVILNNAMVMATLERTHEIGTMRAIGAHRSFVLVMFLIETMVLGLLAGSLGAGLGVLVMEIMGAVGLPASNDALKFVYGGEALYPSWGWENVAIALGIILVVSVISTIYPARVATRIQPVVAMQGKE